MRTCIASTIITGLLLIAHSINAQGQVPSAVDPSLLLPAGPYVIHPHSAEPVGSFDQLIKMAYLIIDGTVASTLPTVISDLSQPGHVETDSIISIGQVIFGSPVAPGQLLLVEVGGKQGKWDVSFEGDPLVKKGERYIFFLEPDLRKNIVNATGILPDINTAPRYYAIDHANGKVLVDSSGKTHYNPGAIAELHRQDNQDVAVYVSALKTRINIIFPPPRPYPKGAKPIPPPPGSLFPAPGNTKQSGAK
jgi:hypothetical protein